MSFLAADRSTGHALGLDLAVIDEAGLMEQRDRALWKAMLTSTSGREGRLLCVSIRGDGPMFDDFADRAGDEAVFWREYAAPDAMSLSDPAAWAAANPGLTTGIEPKRYLRDMAGSAEVNPAHQPSLQAYDLNQQREPSRKMIVSVEHWREPPFWPARDRQSPRATACLVPQTFLPKPMGRKDSATVGRERREATGGCGARLRG